MNKQKKLLALAFVLGFIFLMIILVIVSLLINQHKTVNNTSAPLPSSPVRQAEVRYAIDRSEYLQQHPWLNMLPFKGTNYFISYDPQKDAMLVDLFYKNLATKDQEITQAKQDANKAMADNGIDITKQKIIYSSALVR